MAYRGWDREEMLLAGGSMQKNSNEMIPERPTTSFTPINNHQNQSINPRETLLGPGLDSDSSYDLYEDKTNEADTSKSRKRSATPQGRALFFTPLWEYEDEGGLPQHNGNMTLEEPAPKKKKPASKKRAQSMMGTSGRTLTQAWEQNGEVELNGPHNSQLTTPPDSAKRRKSGPSALRKKSTQNPPFQNPVITKPLTSKAKEAKEAKEVPTAQPLTQYQGFTTTQQQVSLAKTTLEKLAAFRYNPSQADDQASRRPMPVLRKSGPISELPLVYHPKLTQDSSFHGLPPSSEGFFNKATWGAELGSDPFFNESVGVSAETTEINVPPEFHQDQSDPTDSCLMLPPQSHGQLEPLDQAGLFPYLELGEEPIEPRDFVGDIHDFVQSSLDEQEYQKPTSSEARLLNDCLEAVEFDISKASKALHQKRPSSHPSVAESELDTGENGKDIELAPPGISDHPAETASLAFGMVDSPAVEKSKNLHQQDRQDNTRNDSAPETSQSAIHCQTPFRLHEDNVERPGSDEDYVRVEGASRDIDEDDDFDEGLDDDDLLAVVPEPVELQSLLETRPGEEERPELSEVSVKEVALPNTIQKYLALDTTRSDATIHSLTPNHYNDEYGQYDDEFGMDEEDEEELLKLAESTVNILETFVPPASVQDAFERDSDTGEVFDSSLQFSPPKSQAAVLTQRDVAKGHHIDISSTNQSSQIPSGFEPPLGVEEDWTFIRTNRESDPFRDAPPPAIIARSKSQGASPSPAKRSISMQSRATTTMSQLSSKAVFSMIDDSHEYEPLPPFARPPFPKLVLDRCPVVGISAQMSLRVCFRIGEMYREGVKRAASGLNVVIELFARVGFSSREPGTTMQHFQFLDLWHDRPPYVNGILANYKTTGLAESESKVFLSEQKGKMARCLGKLKRDAKNKTGWLLNIINIRETDWEEIRWTKRIVSGDDLAKRVESESRVEAGRNDCEGDIATTILMARWLN